MAQSNISEEEPSANFFEYFDSMTKNVRKTASNMAKSLNDIKNPPNEITQMVSYLNHLHLAPVEEFDVIINNLTHTVNLFNVRLKEKEFIDKVSEKKILEIVTMQNNLLQEIYDLIEKGDELDKNQKRY